MSKVKFLNKLREENNQYSPTHEVQNIDTDADLPVMNLHHLYPLTP